MKKNNDMLSAGEDYGFEYFYEPEEEEDNVCDEYDYCSWDMDDSDSDYRMVIVPTPAELERFLRATAERYEKEAAEEEDPMRRELMNDLLPACGEFRKKLLTLIGYDSIRAEPGKDASEFQEDEDEELPF